MSYGHARALAGECREASKGDRLILLPAAGRCARNGFVDKDQHEVAVRLRPGTVLSVRGIDDMNCAAFRIPRSSRGVVWNENGELVFPHKPKRHERSKPRIVSLGMLVEGVEAVVEKLPSATVLPFTP